MFKRLLGVLVCVGLWAATAPASAQFSAISSPTGAYTGATTRIEIPGANGASLSSVSDGAMTLTFSTSFQKATVGVSGWSTWASPPETETATPAVLAQYSTLASATITLSAPATTFGMEFEPNNFGAFDISVDFMNGGTVLGTVTRSVNGNAGARLFAASSTTPITSVVIRPSGGNGYALANFRYATVSVAPTEVPTLSEWGVLLLSSLLALGTAFVLRRRR